MLDILEQKKMYDMYISLYACKYMIEKEKNI